MARTVTVDAQNTKPTWTFVTVLVLTLVAEVFEDHIKDWLKKPAVVQPIDYDTCQFYCYGHIAKVSRDACECRAP